MSCDAVRESVTEPAVQAAPADIRLIVCDLSRRLCDSRGIAARARIACRTGRPRHHLTRSSERLDSARDLLAPTEFLRTKRGGALGVREARKRTPRLIIRGGAMANRMVLTSPDSARLSKNSPANRNMFQNHQGRVSAAGGREIERDPRSILGRLISSPRSTKFRWCRNEWSECSTRWLGRILGPRHVAAEFRS